MAGTASANMLFLLKTRDLTWQDHSMNIEVMLAPNRTFLLLKKHKTLNARCKQNKDLLEKQLDSAVNSYRSETTMVNRQKQDLYVRRVNRLLETMTDDEKRKVLSRKSYSSSLNKIQEDIVPEYVSHAPVTVSTKSREMTPRIKQANTKPKPPSKIPRTSVASIPQIYVSAKTPIVSSTVPQPARVTALSAPSGEFVGATRKDSFSPTRSDMLTPARRPSVYRRESYSSLPYIMQRQQNLMTPKATVTTPLSIPPEIIINDDDESDTLFPSLCKPTNEVDDVKPTNEVDDVDEVSKNISKSHVRFSENKKPDSAKYRWHSAEFKEKNKTTSLNTKINKFIGDQEKFNLSRHIIDCNHFGNKQIKIEPHDKVEKEHLVDIFDNFCETRNASQLQKLVKLASKMKTQNYSNVSAQQSVKAAKSSKTFQRLQSQVAN